MKTWIFIGCLSVAMVSPRLPAAETSDQRKAKESQLGNELDDLAVQVEDLRARTTSAGAHSRAVVEKQVRNLDNGLSVARKRFHELRAATSAQWEALRQRFEATMARLRTNLRRTETHVEKAKQAK